VTGAVDVRVVTLLGLVLDMRGRDRDAPRTFLGGLVDLVERDGLGFALFGQDLGGSRLEGGEGGEKKDGGGESEPPPS